LIWREAETVRADDHARMQNAALAQRDVLAERDLRDQPGVGSYARVAHYHAARTD
jgi:hypothetical protein